MPALYVPVPRGRALRRVTPVERRPGPLARLWGAVRRRPAVPAYESYSACAAAHPGCDVWRVEVKP